MKDKIYILFLEIWTICSIISKLKRYLIVLRIKISLYHMVYYLLLRFIEPVDYFHILFKKEG